MTQCALSGALLLFGLLAACLGVRGVAPLLVVPVLGLLGSLVTARQAKRLEEIELRAAEAWEAEEAARRTAWRSPEMVGPDDAGSRGETPLWMTRMLP